MEKPQVPSKKNSGTTKLVRKAHQLVFVCVGAWLLFVITGASAYWRVSQSGKYDDLPVKTLGWEEGQKSNQTP